MLVLLSVLEIIFHFFFPSLPSPSLPFPSLPFPLLPQSDAKDELCLAANSVLIALEHPNVANANEPWLYVGVEGTNMNGYA